MGYDHASIEARWQKYWEETQCFRSDRREGKKKFYVLDMFPYPSGSGLHVGHPEGYTATDILARYYRMKDYDVLHPMGWDAFGLPAEQHAVQTGTHPAETTQKNIKNFRRQLKELGFSYDWTREVDTTDPNYVKWTQWIFLKLVKRGLAFQSEIPVNWCPELGTVLANEEVIDGVSERGGYPVVRQPLRQWQLKITAYADQLAQDLDLVDWPETKVKQRDWIGRSEGAEIDFAIKDSSEKITVFTTRADTLLGATYVVIAPDHPRVRDLCSAEHRDAVLAYADATARKSDMERTANTKNKTGVATGSFAIHPLNGKELPIFAADYVLGAYGTGAVMAVPAHDERDFEFAKSFSLPVVEVISPNGESTAELEEAFTASGILLNSEEFNGLKSDEAKSRIVERLESLSAGRGRVNYKLRDWLFSRQRYWGEPIPVYFPMKCDGDPRRGALYEIDYKTPICVEESELPLRLPELEDYHPGDPSGPLSKAMDWRFFEKDGKWFARETNTMPQWAGSCWYYLRYIDPHNQEEIFSEKAYNDWMPVDMYVGGAEHAVLHLLYARFWHKVLFDEGVVKHPEPFIKLVHQGMILGQSYQFYVVFDEAGEIVARLDGDSTDVQSTGEGLKQISTGFRVESRLVGREVVWKEGKPFHSEFGVKMTAVSEKMSKARGNVINPDDVVEEFGADSLRLYEMFMGPLEAVKPWQTSGIQGVRRFLDKVFNLSQRGTSDEQPDEETSKLMHRTVKKLTEDIESMRFNTGISQMMIFVNHLGSLKALPKEAFEKLLLCMAPYAPHLAEELWAGLGHQGGISRVPFPGYDESACVDLVIELPVQVNGKVRGRILTDRNAEESAVLSAAQAEESVEKFLAGKTLRKVIYLPGKILNLIVG